MLDFYGKVYYGGYNDPALFYEDGTMVELLYKVIKVKCCQSITLLNVSRSKFIILCAL